MIFFVLVRRIVEKLPASFSAYFDGEFSALFFQDFRPPKHIHAQNSRPELSAFLSNFTFPIFLFTPIFCLLGRSKHQLRIEGRNARGGTRLRGPESGSEKGVFWKRGLFRKVHFLEILETLEILEFLENPQTLENDGESDHFLEILENLEILEILEIPPVKRPLS